MTLEDDTEDKNNIAKCPALCEMLSRHHVLTKIIGRGEDFLFVPPVTCVKADKESIRHLNLFDVECVMPHKELKNHSSIVK